MTDALNTDELLARLAEHRTVGSAPRAELEWLLAHGAYERVEPGTLVARKGQPVEALYLVLKGYVAHFMEQGGTTRNPNAKVPSDLYPDPPGVTDATPGAPDD